jgi:alpha-amylase
MYESWDNMTFGDMPDLAHRNPYVYAELLKLARWLIEDIGFDGFRYDFVKGYGADTITAVQEYRYQRNGQQFVPYGVAEFWDNAHATSTELGEPCQLLQHESCGGVRFSSARNAQSACATRMVSV